MFDILEKSEDLNISDVASRLKKLNSDISELEAEKDNLEVTVTQNELPEFTEDDLRPYIGDQQYNINDRFYRRAEDIYKVFYKKYIR